jgi:hypothetical protein
MNDPPCHVPFPCGLPPEHRSPRAKRTHISILFHLHELWLKRIKKADSPFFTYRRLSPILHTPLPLYIPRCRSSSTFHNSPPPITYSYSTDAIHHDNHDI